jgi:hypothetical protein
MARLLSLSVSTFTYLIISYGLLRESSLLTLVLPDIFILKDYKSTEELYSTLFHELSHSSHYYKVGKPYWLAYIAAIIYNTGYGDGTRALDGYVGVGEMWGNYFGNYVCCNEYFGSPKHWVHDTQSYL